MKDYIKTFSTLKKILLFYNSIVVVLTLIIIFFNTCYFINDSLSNNFIGNILRTDFFNNDLISYITYSIVIEFAYPPLPVLTIVSAIISLYEIIFGLYTLKRMTYEKYVYRFFIINTLNPIYLSTVYLLLWDLFMRITFG